MANPTTNYGFVLPTATDLVTDLPADFDVALQGVDTRLKALQPGTTLGDIAYSSATANTNTRLPIGTSGQVLAVSGGVPAWTTAAAASGPAFRATRTTTQSISANTTTKMQFNTETFDTDGCYDPTTNFRFTPTKAGYYSVGCLAYGYGASAEWGTIYIYKSGTAVLEMQTPRYSSTGSSAPQLTHLIEMNGTTDYLEVYVRLPAAGTVGDGAVINNFYSTWIRGL